MNKTLKVALVAALALSSSVFAAEGQRKEAVLDGQKLRIVASAPDFAKDPTDFLLHPGVGVGRTDFGTAYEVSFIAPLAEDKTTAAYRVRMTELPAPEKLKVVPDAKWQAEFLIGQEGLKMANAVQIDAPKVPFPDATVVAYRVEGVAFNDPKLGKEVLYVIGVSFPGNKVGYAMSGSVLTPVAAFDADPARVDKRARNVLGYLFKNSTVTNK